MPAQKFSKFRNSSNERLTSGLFIETRPTTQKADPVYTLRDWDHTRPNGDFLPSLYLCYMEASDLTEYTFAEKYLDGWEHWLLLQECDFLKPYIARWRRELELKIKAEALKRLQSVAKDETNKHWTDINKFLVTGGWKEKATKGRPSKREISAQAKEMALSKRDLQSDFERISGVNNENRKTESVN